jgi:hypothetical protein
MKTTVLAAFAAIATTLAFTGGVLLAQGDLPDDVRRALPDAAPQAAPQSRKSTSEAPRAAVALTETPDQSTDQLLQQAIARYRDIVDQKENGRWEAEVTGRLNHLEALLKTLTTEEERVPRTPVAKISEKAVPATTRTASMVTPIAAIEEPSSVVLPIHDVTVANKPIARPHLPAPDDGRTSESVEQLEKLAARCDQLARELRAAVDQLRTHVRDEKDRPAPQTARKGN